MEKGSGKLFKVKRWNNIEDGKKYEKKMKIFLSMKKYFFKMTTTKQQ